MNYCRTNVISIFVMEEKRLDKVMREFNIGPETLADFFQENNINIEITPNGKIPPYVYNLISAKFGVQALENRPYTVFTKISETPNIREPLNNESKEALESIPSKRIDSDYQECSREVFDLINAFNNLPTAEEQEEVLDVIYDALYSRSYVKALSDRIVQSQIKEIADLNQSLCLKTK